MNVLYANLIYHFYMKSLLVQLDEPTFRALNRIAPTAQRQRAEFLRAAIRKAIREAEEERTRQAYMEKRETESADDDWSNAGLWTTRVEPRRSI
jgi:predicted transcriptional regulator